MEFDIEWNLQEFRNEQHELFDENGKRYTGVSLSNDTAEAMLKLINDLECALGKCSKENAALPIFDVSQRSELLLAFTDWLRKLDMICAFPKRSNQNLVDLFLKANNCG